MNYDKCLYDQLPNDFRDNWVRNKIFEVFYLFNIVEKIYKKGNNIIIYKYHSHENKIIHILKYNISLNMYETGYKQFYDYTDAIDYFVTNIENKSNDETENAHIDRIV